MIFSPLYNFYELMNGIFLLEFEHSDDLAMTFLRVQEFYESSNDKFRKNKFTLQEYKDWYITQSEDGTFSYCDDCAGFNVPSLIIDTCYKMHDERFPQDNFFLNICNKCKYLSSVNGLDSYYLIGITKGDDETLSHEIAHGLYTTNKNYRNKIDKALEQVDKETLDNMKSIVADIGYGEDTLLDEAHAYWATGLFTGMEIPSIEKYCYLFEAIYLEFTQDWKMPKLLTFEGNMV